MEWKSDKKGKGVNGGGSRNTYKKKMNELDDVIATVETRTEAKKIAKKEAKSRKEMLWVIDILNDNEVAVYDEKGEEF